MDPAEIEMDAQMRSLTTDQLIDVVFVAAAFCDDERNMVLDKGLMLLEQILPNHAFIALCQEIHKDNGRAAR